MTMGMKPLFNYLCLSKHLASNNHPVFYFPGAFVLLSAAGGQGAVRQQRRRAVQAQTAVAAATPTGQ